MPRRSNKKISKGGSMYAQVRTLRCDGCGRGNAILKVVMVGEKQKALCTACQKKLMPITGTSPAIRQ